MVECRKRKLVSSRMKLEDAISVAIEESKKSNAKYHMGAVIFDSDRFFTGYNRNLFSCYQKNASIPLGKLDHKMSVHAEEMAIQRALRAEMNFNNSTLVVIRINNLGTFRRSYPCQHCRKLITSLGIRLIYYCK